MKFLIQRLNQFRPHSSGPYVERTGLRQLVRAGLPMFSTRIGYTKWARLYGIKMEILNFYTRHLVIFVWGRGTISAIM